MKKIPTIFKRNPEKMWEILDEIHQDCLWVFNNEGIATRKYDGTCTKIENGKYFKRREIKKNKSIPQGFIEENYDKNTGKRVGWIEIESSEKDNKWHIEGLNFTFGKLNEYIPDGTYELVGPKVQSNPENCQNHALISHACAEKYEGILRTFDGLKKWLQDKDIEGLVFHHQDGRMGKIKKKDFQQKR